MTPSTPDVQNVPVCSFEDGSIYYGTELEAVAARLTKGQKLLVDGVEREVACVWFYDCPIVDLVNGGSVIPAFGQTFEIIK